ncbi:glycerophosphoryl diester phosphodiesterase membrane domain-containing protein [Gordonia sp. NPDC058843]|uniref:glycerophosphoryl diester phosphodiesterase membrane domain-containing protein n=1 Tax=Gordonia sp. NPDC058843 TaxID=3346648 RepID=UPI0036AFD600
MSEPPHVSPPPSGGPPWQPPGVSDEWSPVPDAESAPLPLAPPPGWVPHHPTSISDLLQRVFSTAFAAPRVFLGLVGLTWIVAAVPLTLAAFWMVSTDPALDDPDPWTSIFVPVAAFFALLVVQWVVVAGTLTGVAAHPVARLRGGSRPTLTDTWRRTRYALGALLGWTSLFGSAVAAAFTPAIVLFGLGARSGGLVLMAGSLLLTLVAFIPVTWLAVRTVFVAPAIVMDGLSVRDAIGYSGALSATRFWRTCGILAVLGVLAWAVMAAVMYPFDFLGSAAGTLSGGWHTGAATIAAVVGTVVASMVVQPILTVVPAVLYDDARAGEPHVGRRHPGSSGR